MALMPSPYNSVGGEDEFVIDGSMMDDPPVRVRAVRFILRQPSAQWPALGISDVRCIGLLQEMVATGAEEASSVANTTKKYYTLTKVSPFAMYLADRFVCTSVSLLNSLERWEETEKSRRGVTANVYKLVMADKHQPVKYRAPYVTAEKVLDA